MLTFGILEQGTRKVFDDKNFSVKTASVFMRKIYKELDTSLFSVSPRATV